MLITRVKPTHLWGKEVYDDNGHLLGRVVAVRGTRVGEQVNLFPQADARVVSVVR